MNPLRAWRRWLGAGAAWCAACLTASLVAGPAAAQPAPQESAVKAAFLYKFGAFVEWPAGTFGTPTDPLVIGVAGDEAVAASLDKVVTGRLIEGRPVVARRVREPAAAAATHILFVGTDAVVEGLIPAAAPVLVVTDRTGAMPAGSVIHFSTEAGRVRFAVALDAAEARSLKLSARLLAVAQSVRGAGR